MTTSTAQDITFDRAMTEAPIFTQRIDSIRNQVVKADYIWNRLGQETAKLAIREAFRVQFVPATQANIAAALAYVSEGK